MLARPPQRSVEARRTAIDCPKKVKMTRTWGLAAAMYKPGSWRAPVSRGNRAF